MARPASDERNGAIRRTIYPMIIGAVVLLALLFASQSTATRPNTPFDPCHGHSYTAKSFREFSADVWRSSRWRRGRPPAAVIQHQRVAVRCAVGPGNRRAIIATWHRDQQRFWRYRQHMRYCRSGTVITGRVSYFGGGLMASGHYTSEPAIALNIAPGSEGGWDNSTTRGWLAKLQRFRVTIAGQSAVLFVGDLGPAGFTQRAIDVTEGGVDALGLSGAFPTDAAGTARLIPPGC